MGIYRTKFTKEYFEFRQKLTNDQLLNFRATLLNLSEQNVINEGELRKIDVEGTPKFQICVDRKALIIWILGGHWLRQGEPTKEFTAKMQEYAEMIRQGKEPEEAC